MKRGAGMRMTWVGLLLLILGARGVAAAPGETQPSGSGAERAGSPSLPEFDRLWDYDHPDSTEARFLEILPAARSAGDADYLIQLLTQIARARGLQRRFDEAHRTLDEADSLLAGNESKKARVRSLLERGRVYNSSNHRAEARPLFLSAWKLAAQPDLDFFAVDAAHMMGIVEPPDSAIAWNERAMTRAEASEDPKAKGWLGALYNNLGWTYHDRGDYETALGLFRKALDWRRERKDEQGILIARWCVARALRSLGRVEEALGMQERLLRDWTDRGEEDGYVFEEMGECLLALGKPEDARPRFRRAYDLLSKDPWLQENEPQRLARLQELGEQPTPH